MYSPHSNHQYEYLVPMSRKFYGKSRSFNYLQNLTAPSRSCDEPLEIRALDLAKSPSSMFHTTNVIDIDLKTDNVTCNPKDQKVVSENASEKTTPPDCYDKKYKETCLSDLSLTEETRLWVNADAKTKNIESTDCKQPKQSVCKSSCMGTSCGKEMEEVQVILHEENVKEKNLIRSISEKTKDEEKTKFLKKTLLNLEGTSSSEAETREENEFNFPCKPKRVISDEKTEMGNNLSDEVKKKKHLTYLVTEDAIKDMVNNNTCDENNLVDAGMKGMLEKDDKSGDLFHLSKNPAGDNQEIASLNVIISKDYFCQCPSLQAKNVNPQYLDVYPSVSGLRGTVSEYGEIEPRFSKEKSMLSSRESHTDANKMRKLAGCDNLQYNMEPGINSRDMKNTRDVKCSEKQEYQFQDWADPKLDKSDCKITKSKSEKVKSFLGTMNFFQSSKDSNDPERRVGEFSKYRQEKERERFDLSTIQVTSDGEVLKPVRDKYLKHCFQLRVRKEPTVGTKIANFFNRTDEDLEENDDDEDNYEYKMMCVKKDKASGTNIIFPYSKTGILKYKCIKAKNALQQGTNVLFYRKRRQTQRREAEMYRKYKEQSRVASKYIVDDPHISGSQSNQKRTADFSDY